MSKWISVKDRLPGVGARVLVYDADEGVCRGYRGEDRWFFELTRDDLAIDPPLYRVTHWMPLPSSQKETK